MRYQLVITFSLILIQIFMWNNFLYSNESEDALFSREEETFHQTELAEILNKLKNEPLDINHSSSKMLKKLPWLSDNDIGKILDLRKNHFIRNKKSLFKIGINQVTIERILPYISFTRINNLKKYEDKFRMSYKEKTEEISSVKFYNSLKYTQGKFRFGFTGT